MVIEGVVLTGGIVLEELRWDVDITEMEGGVLMQESLAHTARTMAWEW